eukprot:TRINITY_DN17311_c0_g1_i5.p1 TRINITY_DN17311_c0_g1~~TRINITY_DN17311_c0_g1_i5.p1  ORF type:complete len:193 (+),score=20.07 TRINITY_DN17311_c0_g1_i5:99-677(+)
MVVQRCAARPRLAPGNLDDFEEQLRLAPRGGMIDPAGWKNLHKWDCWCQEPPCPQCSYDPLLPLQWAFDRENLAQASFGNQPRAHGQRCLAELPAYETPAMPLSPSAQFASMLVLRGGNSGVAESRASTAQPSTRSEASPLWWGVEAEAKRVGEVLGAGSSRPSTAASSPRSASLRSATRSTPRRQRPPWTS